jgi:hypothetical protein
MTARRRRAPIHHLKIFLRIRAFGAVRAASSDRNRANRLPGDSLARGCGRFFVPRRARRGRAQRVQRMPTTLRDVRNSDCLRGRACA